MAFKIYNPNTGKQETVTDTQIAKNQKKSAQWFRDSLKHNFNARKPKAATKAKERVAKKNPLTTNSTISDPEFKKQTRKVRNVEIGRLYGYLYDPKHKATLKYYDKFPLTLVLGLYNDGWLGMNFHYLPYPVRAKLLEWLYTKKKKTTRKGKEEELIKISYEIVKFASVNKIIAPTIKRYLFDHVKSPLIEFMMPMAFENAIFLPTEQFTKAGRSEVWKDSTSR